eukprot:2043156-Prymnesium_polylepis.1
MCTPSTGSCSCRYAWIARPPSWAKMIGSKSGPEMMALHLDFHVNVRQPTAIPRRTIFTPCATPNEVVEVSSVKMTDEKTMQKK